MQFNQSELELIYVALREYGNKLAARAKLFERTHPHLAEIDALGFATCLDLASRVILAKRDGK